MTLLRRFVAGLLVLICTLVPALAETRVALVVGNSNYQTVGTLDNPVNDASDIAIALEGLGFEVILGRDLTRSGMEDAAGRFANLALQSDVALFYYAGHGFQVNGVNYLVPVDAQVTAPGDVAKETLPMGLILNALEAAPGLKLVFLDACRDNPFQAQIALGDDGQGLAGIATNADFMIGYSTQPFAVAYDGEGRNSYFTEALLNHIYTPGLDISQLMVSVRRDVMAATGGRQIPWDHSSLTRDFQFDQSPVTISEETMLYQVAATAGDPLLMELYLNRYPEGAHVSEVLAALPQDGAAARAAPGSASRTLVGDDAQAERLWNLAQRSRMRPLLEFYVQRYPDGVHVDQALRLLQSLPREQDATPGSICERLATHPRDATASNAGVPFDALRRNALTAIQACSAASVRAPNLPHYIALLARATAASGDLERAIDLYRNAAARGDLRAMVSLAQLSETGTGMPRDPQAALDLYRRAAEGGSLDAMINLAVILYQGAGTPQDIPTALDWMRRAADGGSAKALFNLGVWAQEGVSDQPRDALDYFTQAAQQGEFGGYRAAAILLDEGRGVPRDPEAAANMLLRGAAEDDGTVLGELTRAADQWQRDTMMAVQTRLKAAGYYTSRIDGLSGPNFVAALELWRNGGFLPEVLVN